MEEKLRLYLRAMITNGGSDLHLKSKAITRVRINGKLKVMGKEELSPETVESIARAITTPEQFERLRIDKNLDFTYVMGEEHRFRVNFFYQMEGLSAVSYNFV